MTRALQYLLAAALTGLALLCAWLFYAPVASAPTADVSAWVDGVDRLHERVLQELVRRLPAVAVGPPSAPSTWFVEVASSPSCNHFLASPNSRELVGFLQQPRVSTALIGHRFVAEAPSPNASPVAADNRISLRIEQLTIEPKAIRLELQLVLLPARSDPTNRTTVPLLVSIPGRPLPPFVRPRPGPGSSCLLTVLGLAGLVLIGAGLVSRSDGLARFRAGAWLALAGAGGLLLVAVPPDLGTATLRQGARLDVLLDTSDAVVYPETRTKPEPSPSSRPADNALTRFIDLCVRRTIRSLTASDTAFHRPFFRWLAEEWPRLIAGSAPSARMGCGEVAVRLVADLPPLEDTLAGDAAPSLSYSFADLPQLLATGHRGRTPSLFLPWGHLTEPTGPDGYPPSQERFLALIFSPFEAANRHQVELFRSTLAQSAHRKPPGLEVFTVLLPSVPRSGSVAETFQFDEEKIRLAASVSDALVWLTPSATVGEAKAIPIPLFHCTNLTAAHAAEWLRPTDLDVRRTELFQPDPARLSTDRAADDVAARVAERLLGHSAVDRPISVLRQNRSLGCLLASLVFLLLFVLNAQDELNLLQVGTKPSRRYWFCVPALGFQTLATVFLIWMREERDGLPIHGWADLALLAGPVFILLGLWTPLLLGCGSGRLPPPRRQVSMAPRSIFLGGWILATVLFLALAWIRPGSNLGQTGSIPALQVTVATAMAVLSWAAGAFFIGRFWRDPPRRWRLAACLGAGGLLLVAFWQPFGRGLPPGLTVAAAVIALTAGLRTSKVPGPQPAGPTRPPGFGSFAELLYFGWVPLPALLYCPSFELPFPFLLPEHLGSLESVSSPTWGWIVPCLLLFAFRLAAVRREIESWKDVLR